MILFEAALVHCTPQERAANLPYEVFLFTRLVLNLSTTRGLMNKLKVALALSMHIFINGAGTASVVNDVELGLVPVVDKHGKLMREHLKLDIIISSSMKA